MGKKVLSGLLIAAFAALAGHAAARADPVTLRVKPVLCIIDRHSPQCEMSFVVHWESVVAGHYCLYNDFSVAPLDCWSGASDGWFDEVRVVAQQFSYWMTGRDSEPRLAEAIVEVMSTDSPDRRRQRRKRHAWSVL